MRIVQTKDTLSNIYVDALRIRAEVFMKEQGVSRDIEVDQHEPYCIHFVFYDEKGVALGTCRLLPLDDQTVKLQRMAVLKPYRQRKIGLFLLEEAENFAKLQGYTRMILAAQLSAVGFYEKLGYTSFGKTFSEANMPHTMMEKDL